MTLLALKCADSACPTRWATDLDNCRAASRATPMVSIISTDLLWSTNSVYPTPSGGWTTALGLIGHRIEGPDVVDVGRLVVAYLRQVTCRLLQTVEGSGSSITQNSLPDQILFTFCENAPESRVPRRRSLLPTRRWRPAPRP